MRTESNKIQWVEDERLSLRNGQGHVTYKPAEGAESPLVESFTIGTYYENGKLIRGDIVIASYNSNQTSSILFDSLPNGTLAYCWSPEEYQIFIGLLKATDEFIEQIREDLGENTRNHFPEETTTASSMACN